MYAPCHIGLNSSHFTLTRLILIAVVLITPLLSGSGSRVKLFFHSKRYKSQVFIEAKENTVLFCNNQVSHNIAPFDTQTSEAYLECFAIFIRFCLETLTPLQ